MTLSVLVVPLVVFAATPELQQSTEPTDEQEEVAVPARAKASWLKRSVDHIKLRQSSDDKNTDAKPAQIGVNWTRGKPVLWHIDAALTDPFCVICGGPDFQWELSPLVEYHRLSLGEKPQSLLAAGLTSEIGLGDVSAGPSHHLSPIVGVKWDFQNRADSFVLYVDYVAINFLASGLTVPNAASGDPITKFVALRWLPTISAELEEAVSSQYLGTDGYVLRGRAGLEVRFYIAPRELGERVYVSTALDFRWAILSSRASEPRNDTWTLFRTGITAFVDRRKHFGFGPEYLKGSNPRDGLRDQEYVQLAAKFGW